MKTMVYNRQLAELLLIFSLVELVMCVKNSLPTADASFGNTIFAFVLANNVALFANC